MSTPDQRSAELLATLREIVELSNQALRLRSVSGNTLRAAALMQIRARATGALSIPEKPDNGTTPDPAK